MSTALPRSLETLDYKALSVLEVQIIAAKAMRHQEAQSKIQAMESELQAKLNERLNAAAVALGLSSYRSTPKPVVANGKTAHKPVPVKSKSKVAPKYRNPDNKNETWSGRGRQPRWMVAKIKVIGGNQDQFKI